MHVSHIEVLFEYAHSYLDDNACMLFMILRIESASTTREVVLCDMEAWQRQPSVWETCTEAGNCSQIIFLSQCSIKFGVAHWMRPRPKIMHGVPPAAFTITQSYIEIHIKLAFHWLLVSFSSFLLCICQFVLRIATLSFWMYSFLLNNEPCIWWHVFSTSTKYSFSVLLQCGGPICKCDRTGNRAMRGYNCPLVIG